MRRIAILFVMIATACNATPTATIIDTPEPLATKTSTPKPTATNTSTPEPTADYGDFEDLGGLAYSLMYVGYLCVDYLTYSETVDDVFDSCQECKDFYEDIQTILDDLNVPLEERALKAELMGAIDSFLLSFNSCLAGNEDDMEKYLIDALQEIETIYEKIESSGDGRWLRLSASGGAEGVPFPY